MGCVAQIVVFVGSWALFGKVLDYSDPEPFTLMGVVKLLTLMPVIPLALSFVAKIAVEIGLEAVKEERRERASREREALQRDEADRKQKRLEAQKVLVAKKKASLRSSGAVVMQEQAPSMMLRCTNSHRFMFQDFQIEKSRVGRDYVTGLGYSSYYTYDTEEMGCPACRSKVFSFEDVSDVLFRACNRCLCGYRIDTFDECPLCQLDETLR